MEFIVSWENGRPEHLKIGRFRAESVTTTSIRGPDEF